jgi:SAM-dependent methyltransferase
MGAEAAHLVELEIARTPGDPRRVMPAVPPACRRVLDVGCGAGQTLIASDLGAGVTAAGVDVDFAALSLGRRLTGRVGFVCALGETLPFRDGSFDLVLSRVALPYMHVPRALAEFRRVLAPGGRLWLVLHPASGVLRDLGRAVRAGRAKAALDRLYVLGNGLALHCFGTVFRSPFTPGRCESFQTRRAMRRALGAGFDGTEIDNGPFLVATARKAETTRCES